MLEPKSFLINMLSIEMAWKKRIHKLPAFRYMSFAFLSNMLFKFLNTRGKGYTNMAHPGSRREPLPLVEIS